MQEITTLTSSPNQRHQLVLESNDTVDFRLYYLGRMQSWYYDFTYNNTIVNCNKVVLTPNSLRSFKKILPFGLAFVGKGDIEPFRIDDFSSGRVKMYVLNSDEVEQIEQEIYNR